MGNILEYAHIKLTRDLKRKLTGAVTVDRTDDSVVITVDLGEEGRKAHREDAKIVGAFLVLWLAGLFFIGYSRQKPDEYPFAAAMGLFGAVVMLWRIRAHVRDARDPIWWRIIFSTLGIVGQQQRESGADANSTFCPRHRIGEIKVGIIEEGHSDCEIRIFEPNGSHVAWRLLSVSREVADDAANELIDAVKRSHELKAIDPQP